MYKYNEKLRRLEISLTMGCALNCEYCPQSLLLHRYYENDKKREKYLTFENFKKALEQVDEGATISICGMSEPFSNPDCADMIVYAHEKGHLICLDTTLMGAKLEDLEKIKGIPFENFILHIPDAEYRSKFLITPEYLELLKYVHETQRIDYYSCHGEIHKDVENLIDKEKYAGIQLQNRAGNLKISGLEKYENSGAFICLHETEGHIGIWGPVMLPDGTLVLCCNDYGMKNVLGNLLHHTWQEITQMEPYKKFVSGMNGNKEDLLCNTCKSAKQKNFLPAIQVKKMRQSGITYNTQTELINKFDQAKQVCVYGLGKYFKDHYFSEFWQEGIRPDIFCDKNEEFWGCEINGIPCVSPEQLFDMQDVLVVIFATNTDAIEKNLRTNGINHIIKIKELYELE